MIGRRKLLAPLCAAWLCLAAAAPPRLEVAAYEEPIELAGGDSGALTIPVEPGEQYPPTPREEAASPAVAARPAAAPARSRAADFRLSVDMSVTADSNVTNGTNLRTVPIDLGDGPLPVPVDPNLREKAGIGAGVSAAANVRLPIAAGAALAVDVEGYAVE